MADNLYALNDHIKEASKRTGISQDILKAVITQESGGNPQAVSKAGAMGAMQLMPATAKSLGVTDPMDPRQNINAGADYLKQLNAKYNGDWNLTLAAYNAGPGNVDKHGGIPPFEETQNYVKNVNRLATKINANSTSEKPIDRLEARYGHLIDAKPESKSTGDVSAIDRLEARYGKQASATPTASVQPQAQPTVQAPVDAQAPSSPSMMDIIGSSALKSIFPLAAVGSSPTDTTKQAYDAIMSFARPAVNAATFGADNARLRYLTGTPSNEVQAQVQKLAGSGAKEDLARTEQLKAEHPVLSTAGDIAGFIVGPGRAISAAAGAVPAGNFLAKLAKTATQGAAEGGAFEAVTNKDSDIDSMAQAAKFGAAGSVITKGLLWSAGKIKDAAGSLANKTMRNFFVGKNAGEVAKAALEYPRLSTANSVDEWAQNADNVIADNTEKLNTLLKDKFSNVKLKFKGNFTPEEINKIAKDIANVADREENAAWAVGNAEGIAKVRGWAQQLQETGTLPLDDANNLKRLLWEEAKFNKMGDAGASASAKAARDLGGKIAGAIDKVTDGAAGSLNKETSTAIRVLDHLKQVDPSILSVGTAGKSIIGTVFGGPVGGAAATALDAATKNVATGTRIANLLHAAAKVPKSPARDELIRQVNSILLPSLMK